jgi:hypothetical protein
MLFNIVQSESTLPIVKFQTWIELKEKEREIYVKSLLETWSFNLYSMSDKQKSPSEFSAFTACAETEKISSFIRLVDTRHLFGEISKPVVAHIFDKTPLICKEYISKGDNSFRPVRIIQKQDWENFSDQEKKIYLTGYLDLNYFLILRILDFAEKNRPDKKSSGFINETKNDKKALEKCLGQVGVEGIFITLSKQFIEWQYPLPWSVSAALGDSCKAFR